jgi:hypothetical protein
MTGVPPRLIYRPSDPLTPFQWHSWDAFDCPVTGKPSSYLAGFRSYDAAVAYGAGHGWAAPSREYLTGGGRS